MKISLLAMLAMLVTQAATSDTAAYFSFLSDADRQSLLETKELTAVGSNAAALPFGTKAPFAEEVKSGLTVAGSTVAIEGLFLFPKPAGDAAATLYNAVNAVASMEGLEYYSATRKRMEPLILASYRVDSAEKMRKVPDPRFTEIPAFQRAVIFQKDNKLGDGLSEVTWKALSGGATVMTIKNLDTLNYGILPLVAPGNLQMLFVVVPLTDSVVVYGVMEGKTASLFGLERSKDESFRNRMRALASWLGTRIATVK